MKKLLLVITLGLVALAGSIFIFNYKGATKPTGAAWGEPVQITKGTEVNSVQFLPDGKLLFASNDGIFITNVDGTDMQMLFHQEGIRRANISPDGRKIVFDNDFDIFTVNPDGNELNPIANDPDIFEFAISFTPDGKAITFVTIDDVNFTYGIWIMDPDGNNKKNLLLSNDFAFRHPRQSPSDTQISYFTTGKGKKPIIWVMNKEGTNNVALTDPDSDGASRQASWSSNGRLFVYSSKKQGDFDIWTMDVNGENKTQITRISGNEAKPVWSPDGQTIAFVCSDCFGEIGSDVYVISKGK